MSDVTAGDEVFGFSVGGAAAEHAVLDDYARKPGGLAWEDAAALPVAVETSLRVFNVLGGLGEGQTIVVNGAAGGVGVAAVQIARARGARVIGTASETNHEFLRALGAEPTMYGDGMVERIRALAPDGVDLAFDTAGKGGVPDLITLTGDPARVATIIVSRADAAPDATQTFAAGEACPFALQIDLTDLTPQVDQKTFVGRDGRFRVLSAGTGSDLVFTTLATGKTFVLNGNGFVSWTRVDASGSARLTLTGHNVLIYVPTDIPAGPSTTLVVGREDIAVDLATFQFRRLSRTGHTTDICAALS